MSHNCIVVDQTSTGGNTFWRFICECKTKGRLRKDRWRATRDARQHQDRAV